MFRPAAHLLRPALRPARQLQSGLLRNSARFSTIPPPARDTAELDSVTTLSNGLRVATEALPGHFSGVGVFVDAGARYENEDLRGCSHLIDRLAFKSTTLRTEDEMFERIQHLGGNVQCASSRDSMMYQAAVFNKDVEEVTELLAETVRTPKITDSEVEQQLGVAAYEIDEIISKPELVMPEWLHQNAYDGTLGNPLLCPEDRLDEITADTLKEYRRIFYRPERIVLAFAGVDHETAVRLAEKYFGDMVADKEPFPQELARPAVYKGRMSAFPLPESHDSFQQPLTQVHVGFEGLSINSDDIYTLATMQMLLGGGGSFSAGGPGKGMYSRLYTSVLNQHGWIESCVAFNNAYKDSGLFGIAASCGAYGGGSLAEVIMRQFSASRTVTDDELNRAKNQLRSSLLMNLESRMVELEDLGRQVQNGGKKMSATAMCEHINSVTKADVRRVMDKALKCRPSAVISTVGGAEEDVATLTQLQEMGKKYGVGVWS